MIVIQPKMRFLIVEENALFAKIITILAKINAFKTNVLSLLKF